MSDPRLAAAAPEAAAPPPDALEQELAAGRALILRVLRAQFPSVSREEGEDIAQELMVDFWHQRERIRQPAAWFYTAARSRGISAVTRGRVNVPLDALGEDEQPAEGGPDEQAETLRRLFFTLQEQCRKVLGCLVLAGWTMQEVAEAARCSMRQVNEQRARCIKSLRRRWLDTAGGADEA